MKEGVASGVEGEARSPDLRKDSRAWRTSGSSFGVWFIGIRHGGGDERMHSQMSWKSEDAESRGRAPGLDCREEGAGWAASAQSFRCAPMAANGGSTRSRPRILRGVTVKRQVVGPTGTEGG
jgi:hypothetical protein